MKYIIFALFIAAAAAVPSLRSKNVIPYGPIEDIINCGSEGDLREARVEDCDALPCSITPGRSYLIEVDFQASASSNSLRLLVTGKDKATGQEHVVVDQDIDGSIVGGELYTLAYELSVSNNFAGRSLELKIELHRADGGLELCGIADVNVTDGLFKFLRLK